MGISRMEMNYLLYKMSCVGSSGLTEWQERALAGVKLVKAKRSTNMEIRAGVPAWERERKEEDEPLEREAAEAEKKQKEEEARERETREAAEREAKLIKQRDEKSLSLGPEPEKGPDVTQVRKAIAWVITV